MTGDQTGGYIVRGVPASLKQDSWWLGCEGEPEASSAAPTKGQVWADLVRKGTGATLALVVLTALADWLFWSYAPGISAALFSWALYGAAVLLRSPDIRQIKPALLCLLLSSLPVIEHSQALSWGFQFIGLVTATAWIHLPARVQLPALASTALDLLRSVPFSGLKHLRRSLFPELAAKPEATEDRAETPASAQPSALAQYFRNWSFPIGGALVLVTLLLQANPLLEKGLLDLLSFDYDIRPLLHRLLFWSGAALMIWPFLQPVKPASKPKAAKPARQTSRSYGLNAGSVLRALVMFNLILAVQSLMDLSILMGGAALPEGMTLANYAHRGAYPLLATAMLAGGFALAARPYLENHASLKPLMMLWLGQNALLGLTSLLRLDLYVASFGLTYMRIYAMIWIGLVVVGLLLTAWQILRARSNSWLLLYCTGLGLGTLYICAFVNFAATIATQNLSGKTTVGPDWYYLCNLGPTAAHALTAARDANPDLHIPQGYASCWDMPLPVVNWREWGFRNWRVSSYAGAGFND
ncbi:DUF4173 domain-containing protein [Pseudophaeobacter sp.]|uniref:DUF4153 domain-containing protein n=1 Tax=Pseudophaeobacter sp. TaxID=1971739 RepID=UPI0032976A8C